MEATPAVTAIASRGDAVARHAIRTLAEAGVEVPRDMSVTGFDDDPIAEWTSPPLTTIRQDFDEIGGRAFALLEKLLEGGAPDAAGETVPVSFVARGSVGSPGPRPLARTTRAGRARSRRMAS